MSFQTHKVMISRPLSVLTYEFFSQMRDAGIAGIEVSPKQHECDTMAPLPIKDTDRAEKLRLAKSAFAELAEYAAPLAVENLPLGCM